jgi:hypothetical protein
MNNNKNHSFIQINKILEIKYHPYNQLNLILLINLLMHNRYHNYLYGYLNIKYLNLWNLLPSKSNKNINNNLSFINTLLEKLFIILIILKLFSHLQSC